MKNLFLLSSSLAVIVALNVMLSSCGGDDAKPSKAQVSFSSATKTVQESAGTVEVKVLLDKPISSDLIVSYELSGTATQKAGIVAGDYEITGDAGEVTIAKGETTGVIQINIVNDSDFESDETIIFTLANVNGTEAEISNDDQTTVTIQSDDLGPKVSFTSTTTISTYEDDRSVQLEVQLDETSTQDITISYVLSGTAIDSVKAKSQSLDADYAIQGGSPGQLTIAAGETTGIIKIKMYSDFELEDGNFSTQSVLDPETIKVTLQSADGGGATIDSNKDEVNINVTQEDGMIVQLSWDYTTVDMDLALWIGPDAGSMDIYALSAFDNLDANNPTSFELLFVPKIFTDGTTFGLSYVYYAGDKDPMNFQVDFIDVASGTVEAPANWTTSTASYGAVNKHVWANTSELTLVEQTFDVTSGNFANFSAITVPAASSRTGTHSTNKMLYKSDKPMTLNRQFK